MKQILVYYGKHGNVYWDSTDKNKAYLALFKFLDEEMEFYEDLKDADSIKKDINELEKALVELEENISGKNEILFRGYQRDITNINRELSWNKSLLDQASLYTNAKKGIADCANRLLSMRKDNEYENWDIERVEEIE